MEVGCKDKGKGKGKHSSSDLSSPRMAALSMFQVEPWTPAPKLASEPEATGRPLLPQPMLHPHLCMPRPL